MNEFDLSSLAAGLVAYGVAILVAVGLWALFRFTMFGLSEAAGFVQAQARFHAQWLDSPSFAAGGEFGDFRGLFTAELFMRWPPRPERMKNGRTASTGSSKASAPTTGATGGASPS